MSAPVNYTSVYQTTSTINEIKIESEQIKMEETISLFLPHHMSESGYTCEDEIDSSQMKKYPLDVNYDATETDPLAIDGTNFIKSENLKIKNELEIDTTDPLAVDETEFNKTDYFKIKTERVNDNVKTEEIDIDDDYLQKFKTEEVELPSHAEETIQERTENCLSKSVNVDMNKKKYECNFCSKFLTSNYNLQKHLNKHTKGSVMEENEDRCYSLINSCKRGTDNESEDENLTYNIFKKGNHEENDSNNEKNSDKVIAKNEHSKELRRLRNQRYRERHARKFSKKNEHSSELSRLRVQRYRERQKSNSSQSEMSDEKKKHEKELTKLRVRKHRDKKKLKLSNENKIEKRFNKHTMEQIAEPSTVDVEHS
ncbi:uncharacterized protein LOC142333587 isoform X1 [Lycorma delicatula]|uniref:uncharacterized protein LOC142333587 isoform X1 n=1 Tax=Lycorma delicatula TaxID=130591 RepID=UPI003F516139